MNGKLLIRLVESAINGDADKVKMLTNMLSSELKNSDPALSSRLAQVSSQGPLRSATKRNPHSTPIKIEEENKFVRTINTAFVEKPIWSENVENSLLQVLSERQNFKKLAEHGLEPSKTLLFTGPPGVGKTLSALWLADSLGLPLQVLDLASVMSSYLGKTGTNLRSVIDSAASMPCVLLLDEFDAIAKKRDDDSDVGELKRLVTVLLQTLDDWPATSLLIGATNHPELLDPAIWRRFNEKITFELPNDLQIEHYLLALTKNVKVTKLYAFFRGQSYSDIKTTIDKSKKYCVINDVDMVEHLLNTYVCSDTKSSLSKEELKNIAKYLVLEVGVSQRKAASLLGLSRPTVKAAVEK
ncbi:ATP-binding protein [Vibrio vulnificus]|uniref:AAA family ATPase n=1 Tax=Vibrio TaxID=662 RepID=UPI0003F4C601|nr:MULTISPECIES: ATP-binding protein [Vibrio]EGQ7762835.1 AAA family ATPase [Vibrio alginolyticus]ELP2653644.1 AAA family ATPase [Vibrio fluvialis]ELS0762082.1 AAA family ATPase [Vibrio vulnificus]ELF6831602.1 AAA family ATPase [Vibrio cholerae]MDF4486269.1 ATP-binding protein [Vibrio parahaemolyticus]